jgi:hypothetical protein
MFLRRLPRGQRQHQHGAAALIVVMLLFFVISLVAAYTSRNLVFEQRTASNQYRSTQAMEAAEAGVEWAIAQLNAGLINDTCQATTTSGNQSFRQRYLSIDSGSGDIVRRTASGAGTSASVTPMCVFDGGSGGAWSCRCPQPTAAPAVLATPSGAGTEVAPAFVVRLGFPVIAGRPDLVRLESNSCTRLSTVDCLNFNTSRGGTGDGVASVRVMLALRGALNRLPVAPLTVMGTVATPPSGVVLSLRNVHGAANSITLHTAGASPGTGLSLSSAPGSSAASSIISNDGTLQPAAQTGTGFNFEANDLRFASIFGISPQTYRNQPGLPVLDCSSGCDGDDIEDAVERNPSRPIWLTGSSGTVTLDEDLGTDTNPVMLIVEGNLAIDSGITVRGVIYHRAKPAGAGNTTWAVEGAATIRGAVIVEDGFALSGTSATPTLEYSPVVLRAVKVSMGSFVRVPGSWRDF